uniref:Uncharacterized protein n=1 Tax=Anguilla anguilla TaxID=7936 RepID=A0A0E9UP77_ANGAN
MTILGLAHHTSYSIKSNFHLYNTFLFYFFIFIFLQRQCHCKMLHRGNGMGAAKKIGGEMKLNSYRTDSE